VPQMIQPQGLPNPTKIIFIGLKEYQDDETI
jgi:hypothetical protein